jgi:hypothetical protein
MIEVVIRADLPDELDILLHSFLAVRLYFYRITMRKTAQLRMSKKSVQENNPTND